MNICIFGDSITWGATDCEKGGWAERLKAELMAKDIDVYNLGISGDTTEEILKRFDAEAEARNPDIIIFAIGINDSLNIGKEKIIDTDKFQDNISSLFYKAKKITDKISFVGLTNVDETKTNPYFPSETGKSYNNQSIGEYDEAIKIFCEEKDIAFVDMFGLLINDEDLYDGLHPTSIGHQKMLEKIKKELEHIWKD